MIRTYNRFFVAGISIFALKADTVCMVISGHSTDLLGAVKNDFPPQDEPVELVMLEIERQRAPSRTSESGSIRGFLRLQKPRIPGIQEESS